ncbi:MAG: type IX secretion system sortase PorU, partial [Chitinophagaceae bacterium]
MTALCRSLLLLVGMGCSMPLLHAQRTYKNHSVFASGSWYRIAVPAEGIYKMDAAFLSGLGLGGNIASASLRLYGATPGMLPEANGAPRTDDLEEIALSVQDGGDGTLNGGDFVTFFAPGPHPWQKDSLNRSFTHRRHLYSDVAYYYLTIGGAGRRIGTATALPPAPQVLTAFDERYFYEKDSVNFLSSGREWYGEEFSALPGRSLSRAFAIPAGGAVPGTTIGLRTRVAARSIGGGSRFDIALNGAPALQVNVASVTGIFNDIFAQATLQQGASILNGSTLGLTFNYLPGGPNAQGWLDWFEVVFRRQLAFTGSSQLLFRDWSTVGTGPATFRIAGAPADAEVWDVTDPFSPERMAATVSGSGLSFTRGTERLREYAAFGADLPVPIAAGAVPNQDLHATAPADYLIITHPDFAAQGQQLAAFHQQRSGLRSVVVTTSQVFQEFGGGTPDPAAIRDFVKMYYDRYRSTWTASGKYLLLLGRGSFDPKDRVRNNTNFVPAWESPASLDPLATYTSDDFYGFLDDNEDINSGLVTNTLDVGIGRIPVRNAGEARNFIEKLLAYHSPAALGPWRNNATFVADDQDLNLHLEDAETMTATTAARAPFLNLTKIYLDAYRKEGGTAGGTYPGANAAINNNVLAGTLIWNYSGHGGYARLAEETILDQDIVNNWNNSNRLPLFITATCDFAPYDLPGINSLGENLLVRPKTGAIALMTTTRVVFAYSNRIMNDNYLRIALEPDASGRYKTLGEAVQAAKNYT